MDSTTLDILAKLAAPASVLINAAVLIYVVRQVRLMQIDLRAQSHIEMIARWNNISELEIENPEFHKLVMGPKALLATKELSEADLRKRAFFHMLMDVLAQRSAVEKEIGQNSERHEYLYSLMQNADARRYWSELHVREAFEGDPFQVVADRALAAANV